MAKISSYGTATPVLTDKLIGTDIGGDPADSTKNFLLSDVQTLFKAGIGLSDVLAAGNTATANIVLTGDITATNLFALTAVTGTTITASGTVTGTTVTATGTVNGANVTAVGAVTGDAVIGLTAVSAPTVTATGTVVGPQIKVTSISPIVATDLLITGLPTYADQAAAVLGGLATNGIYKTVTGELRIVV